MIKIQNISKSFGEHILFNNLSLDINDGDFVVVSGGSGCGKTTLLNMIGGIEEISDGKIIVDGYNISERRNKMKYFRTKVGFLFQNFALIENKTVKQNLELVRKSDRNYISIEQVLEKVGLADKINSKVYTLSGGEQQRIALARLMVKKCDIILADEPTGSLDKANAKKIVSLLRELNEKEHKTVIMVTHDENLKKQGSRIIELQ